MLGPAQPFSVKTVSSTRGRYRNNFFPCLSFHSTGARLEEKSFAIRVVGRDLSTPGRNNTFPRLMLSPGFVPIIGAEASRWFRSAALSLCGLRPVRWYAHLCICVDNTVLPLQGPLRRQGLHESL